ncbi:MAG: hypothetical protein R2827_01670 [Bdellovibrionales bacterium]
MTLQKRTASTLWLINRPAEYRTESFNAGMRHLMSDFNNNAGSYFAQHLKGLENIAGSAAQGQYAIGTMAFTFGNALSAMLATVVGVSAAAAANTTGMDPFSTAFAGIMSSVNMLLMKHTFLGYAYTWTYAHAMYHAVTSRIESMKNSIARFSGLIERGVSLDRPDMYRYASWELVKLYRAVDKESLLIEAGLIIRDKNSISPEQAAKILQVTLNNRAFFTKESRILELMINVGVGAVASTLLSVSPIGPYSIFTEVFPNLFAEGYHPLLVFGAFTPVVLALRSANIQFNKWIIRKLEGRKVTEVIAESSAGRAYTEAERQVLDAIARFANLLGRYGYDSLTSTELEKTSRLSRALRGERFYAQRKQQRLL